MFSPKKIKEYVDKYVTGQEDAKNKISNLLFLHALKVKHLEDNPLLFDPEKKNLNVGNLMLVGPSGCGKTYIIQKACEYVDLPVAFINAKSLTNTGHVGVSIQEAIAYASINSRRKSKFNYSVIVIDELDKICVDFGSNSGWMDNIQSSLLKVVEGFSEPVELKGYMSPININTHNMLFLFAGNFEDMRKKLNAVKSSIGFSTDEKKEKLKLNFIDELIATGLKKELAGRISSIVQIKQLTKEEIKDIILNKQASALDDFVTLFEAANTELDIKKEEIIDGFAEECFNLGLGARGLNSIIFNYLENKIQELEVDLNEKKEPVTPKISYQNDLEARYKEGPVITIRAVDLMEDDDDNDDGKK